MKNQTVPALRTLTSLMVFLLLVGLVTPRARAGIAAPYNVDANTLFLFHLSEPPGSEPGGYDVCTNLGTIGGVAITSTNGQSANQQTNPPPVTDMLGAAAYPGFGYCLTNTSTTPVDGLAGFDVNKNGRFNSEGTSNVLIPSADYLAMTNFNMGNPTNTPFTIEAMICPANNNAGEILCSDSALSRRGFQFRLSSGTVNFNPINSGPSVTALIPVAGNNAFVNNTWFHVAAVYDGTNDYIYWTLVNPTNTTANLLTNVSAVADPMTPVTFGTNVLGPLVIGNSDRGNTGPWAGRLGEIRISSVARAANQMLFANTLTLSASPTNANTAIGGTVYYSVAATSDYSLTYLWRTNGVPITNGTDAAGAVFSGANTAVLQIANAQLADAGFTYSCSITNSQTAPAPLGTNSTTATLSVITPHYLTWTGTADGTWSTAAGADWFDTVAMANTGFTTLDNVTFDNTGTANTVSITNAVQPVIASVVSSSVNYTFTGNGKITGTTGLTKSNGSTLTIQTTNDYSGITTINGGIVSVGQLANGGSASAIGAAPNGPANIVLNGGDLQYTGPTAAIDRGATLGAGGGIVEVTTVGNALTLGGTILGSSGGNLVKNGNGTLLLGGTNTYNGTTTVNAGLLGLSGNVNGNGSFGPGIITNNSGLMFSGGSSAVTFVVPNTITGSGILTNDSSGGNIYIGGTNSFTGNIYFNGPGTLTFASSNALGNATNVTLLGVGGSPYSALTLTNNEVIPSSVSLVGKVSNGLRISVNANLAGNGGGSWNGPMTFISSDNNAGTFQFGAGSTNANSPLVINGNVTGVNLAASTVVAFRNGGSGGTRFGTVNGNVNFGPAQFVINDGAYWTVNSSGNSWGNLFVANGRIILGANNALCTTAPLMIGSGGSTAVVDLNGNNQLIDGLTNNGTTGPVSITNSAATPVTLTYNNPSANTYNNFTNSTAYIKDAGAGTISLTVAGGSLLLNNSNNAAYHGVTTVSGSGVLTVSGSAQLTNNSAIAVTGSAAKLDVSTLGFSFSLIKGQNLSGIGVVTGAVTAASGAILAPGNSSIGTLSFSNGLTLNATSTNTFAVTSAGGASNSVIVAGLLTPNSSVIKVTSGTALLPGTNTLFTYVTSSGAFNPVPLMDVPPVHPPAVINNGAGQINLVVSNRPPVAQTMTVTRTAGLNLQIPLTAVATNWSDPDGDTVTLLALNLTSTNGVTLSTNSGLIQYPNSANVNDQISYTITDGYGGTATGYINIAITNGAAGPNSISSITTGTSNSVTAYGVPGYNYALERTTNIASTAWVDINTNTAATNGVINLIDTFWDLGGVAPGSAYYRLKWEH